MGGIKNPPQIPHHEIPLIGAGLVSMGGMGGIFQAGNLMYSLVRHDVLSSKKW